MIELMQADLPHTLFRDEKKVKQEDIDYAIQKMLELRAKKQKRLEEEKELTIDEVFDKN